MEIHWANDSLGYHMFTDFVLYSKDYSVVYELRDIGCYRYTCYWYEYWQLRPLNKHDIQIGPILANIVLKDTFFILEHSDFKR